MSADPIVYCLENLTDYLQFERLCCDLMQGVGFADVEPLGGSNDRGRDAVNQPLFQDDNEKTIFAFSVRSDWERKLLREDCKRIAEEQHDLDRLVFCCTSSISSTKRDEIKSTVMERFGWDFELFDIERLRLNLTSNLRHLISKHPTIFCPPFFPTKGGLSVAPCADTIVIDHQPKDHALATWLARKLQLNGFLVWCYGTAPLAGETPDQTVRELIESRATKYLPILSNGSVADIDFIARVGTAGSKPGFLIPCFNGLADPTTLPTRIQTLSPISFGTSWATGIAEVLESLANSGIVPVLSEQRGKAIAVRSYVPEPVTKPVAERVYTNTFSTKVPAALLVCKLEQEIPFKELENLRHKWAFVVANSKTLLSFTPPPPEVPLKQGKTTPRFSWRSYNKRHGKKSLNVVKELVRRSLYIACANAGMEWCGNRKKYFYPVVSTPRISKSYVHVDGRKTHVAVTGEKTLGYGDRAAPFRYQLCPCFKVGQDTDGGFWTTMRIYVRVTDLDGVPYIKKAITRRRKNVAKSWWNKEWFARTLGLMQSLETNERVIEIGSGKHQVVVSTIPMMWDCPVAIDYEALQRVGDFQEEMASMRYVDLDDKNEIDDELLKATSGDSKNE